MNNKGFGLQELLVFIGIFLFILVAITIYGNAKLGNDSFYEEPDVKVEEESTINDTKPTEIEIPKEYVSLENKLKAAAKKYSFNRTENVIITLKELQDSNLIGNLADPNDNSILCNGYVVYNTTEDKYMPYINCNGMYATESYDSSLVN